MSLCVSLAEQSLINAYAEQKFKKKKKNPAEDTISELLDSIKEVFSFN